MEYQELLWLFSLLPDSYVCIDLETTGLPDISGPPDIVTIGIVTIRDKQIVQGAEFQIKPSRPISKSAQDVHGISDQEAASFRSIESQWPDISSLLSEQLIVIHNASFDWPILIDHTKRFSVKLPSIKGVFCSQKSAFPWALANKIKCSERGPSLNTLTEILRVQDLRGENEGVHGALIDSRQTALMIERLREEFSPDSLRKF